MGEEEGLSLVLLLVRDRPHGGDPAGLADLREVDLENVDQGPRALAIRGVATGQLDRCVATRTAEWLLGREVDVEREAEWIAALALDFAAAEYSYRELVRAIVLSESYRRVR